jgi:hypothetical protein
MKPVGPLRKAVMAKLVLHLLHDGPAALATVPALAERIQQASGAQQPALEVFIFGPAEGALSAPAEGASVVTF